LNPNEKRALYSFLSIYTLSALVLMGIIALLYYNKAVHETKTTCKTDLQSTILSAEMDLRKACMYDKAFHFLPDHYKLHIGLFDDDRREIAGNLRFNDVNFSKMMDPGKARVQMVKKLHEPVLGVRYIVAEDLRIDLELGLWVNVEMYLNCLYYTVVTFTTLGYGEITPPTLFTRHLASTLAFARLCRRRAMSSIVLCQIGPGSAWRPLTSSRSSRNSVSSPPRLMID